MPYAMNLRSDNASADALRDLWNILGRFEREPSMAALNYPPHLTLAIYEVMDESALRAALQAAFAAAGPLPVSFDRLGYFQNGDRVIVWAAAVPTPALREAHAAVHRTIDDGHCRANYRPDTWIPHCTLALDVSAAHRAAALDLVNRDIEPFQVTFDVADCAAFPPVTVLHETPLAG